MNPAEAQYKKALTYAIISCFGFIMPAIGLILALRSYFLLKKLNPTNTDEQHRIKRARIIAYGGAIISLWPLWLFAIAAIKLMLPSTS